MFGTRISIADHPAWQWHRRGGVKLDAGWLAVAVLLLALLCVASVTAALGDPVGFAALIARM